MKKILLTMIVALLLASVTIMAGCITEEGNDEESIPPTYSVIDKEMNEYVSSCNEFAYEMYKQLVNSDDNVFFSPYSISTALGMAYEGARGDTASEMANVLDFPKNDQVRRDMVKDVQSQLNKDGTSYDLSAANAYWLKKDKNLEEEYRNVIESYYLAHGRELDFDNDLEGSVNEINEWVAKETNDKIKDLLSTSDITPLTYLILTNAIYFKADWIYQFDASATKEMSFYKTDGEEIITPMMHMCDESKKLNYASNSDVQLLQLPYKDEELSMLILLPKENDIASFETKLDHEYLSTLKDEISAKWIDLYLPKFKFEQKYRLENALSYMGMPTAFGMAADFSGITTDTELYIDKVIHQSFVEVNEEGTEAAAATAVVMAEKSGGGPSKPKPIEFRADHPFIFLIEHKDTGQILFMGKVEDPSK